MNTYALELKHDGGHYFVRVHTTSKKAAIEMVMKMENCPKRSIIWIEKVGKASLLPR